MKEKDKRHIYLLNIAYAIHQALHPHKKWVEVTDKTPYLKAAEAVDNLLSNEHKKHINSN